MWSRRSATYSNSPADADRALYVGAWLEYPNLLAKRVTQ